ncbi:MAG: NAD(P)-dependent oxidoreductase [Acidimicrobiales bacterium]
MGNAEHTIGWIGTGRMGSAMVERLISAGLDVSVYNRTRSKLEPLVAQGAKAADTIGELAGRRVVFVTVGSSEDLLAVLGGESGLLRRTEVPEFVIDCSTVSVEASAEGRALAESRGAVLLAAPVSGNPKVARAGRLTMAVSGPRGAFDEVEPYLRMICAEVTYVGEDDVARLVKLCHNLFLGAVIQALVEVTTLAEKAGVTRHDFLAFLNDSVMGSTFSRYKTPQLVNLEFAPTFTTRFLLKDFDLGLAVARALEVPMPVVGLVHQLVQAGVGEGLGDRDFAALLEIEARAAGINLRSEHVEVSDGLRPEADAPKSGGRERQGD